MALGKKVVTTKTTTTKIDIYPITIVSGEDFAEKLNKFVTIKEDIKNLTADQKSVEGDIKTIALEEYVKLYTSIKKNPDSIKIESDKGDRIMFIVQKKYTGAVDEERATELREKYGKTFVEEKSEMIMNNDILNKYSDELEELIMGAEFMTDDEKNELFINKITYSIKSDAINDAFTSGNGDVSELISDINPVLMLKETK